MHLRKTLKYFFSYESVLIMGKGGYTCHSGLIGGLHGSIYVKYLEGYIYCYYYYLQQNHNMP